MKSHLKSSFMILRVNVLQIFACQFQIDINIIFYLKIHNIHYFNTKIIFVFIDIFSSTMTLDIILKFYSFSVISG